MGFIQHGGFLFKPSGPAGNLVNGLGDSYHNDCVPETVGVGNKIPVTVRVTQGVTQSVIQTQGQGQGVTQSQGLAVTVQQSVVWVPQQQQVQNPVRVRSQQTVFSGGQEVTVAEIPTDGNDALTQFESQGGRIGVTDLIQAGVKANKILRVLPALAREIASANKGFADMGDAIGGAASKGVSEGKFLADKLRGANPQVVQQILQRVGVPFTEAQQIANAARLGSTATGEMLEQLALNQIREFQRQFAEQTARTATRVCAI